VIHTDFQKGFIKAEIVSYEELMSAGSMLKAESSAGADGGQGLRHAGP
jgi:ribosome-binding ATPase